MASASLTSILQYVRRVARSQDCAGTSDAQLLASFIDQKDEIAFAALVHRHSPMVWSVCRRAVRHEQDAEDAFQATFLVLAVKATSINPRHLVANWLFGVAHRTASKARVLTAKRRRREMLLAEKLEGKAVQENPWRDIWPVIDEELSRLPDKYRMPVFLCDIEGKTIRESTLQLGWPQGTFAGRLARGRKMLASRLARRGVVLSGMALALAHSQNVTSAGVPVALMNSTIRAATLMMAGQAASAGLVTANSVGLMKGVTKSMFLTNFKTLSAALLVLTCGVFGGQLLTNRDAQGRQTESTGDREPIQTRESPTQVPKRALDQEQILVPQDDLRAQIAALRTENAKLRLELQSVIKEIRDWKDSVRNAAPPKEPEQLFRGKPTSYWLAQFKDADPKFRQEALEALANLAQNDKNLIPRVVAALKDKHYEVGQVARNALGELSSTPEVLSGVLEILEDKQAPFGATNAANVIADMGPGAKSAVPRLIKLLPTEDASLQQWLIHDLGMIGTDARPAIPELIKILGNSLELLESGKQKLNAETLTLDSETLPVVVVKALENIDPSVKEILPKGLYPPFNQSNPWVKERAALWQQALRAVKKKYEK